MNEKLIQQIKEKKKYISELGFKYNESPKLCVIVTSFNQKNNITFTEVDGIPVKKAFLEDQPPHFAATIKSVPTLVLYVDGRLSYSWQAGIDLKCKATPSEVKEIMDKFR